jgi:hypothetical protein
MSLNQPAQSLGTEFSVFLRSPVWEEKSGGSLSLLSAFARLDLDPWQEAASLAALSREAAARQLAQILARLPASQADAAFDSMCARSVGLLPAIRGEVSPGPPQAGADPSRPPSGLQLGLLAAWMVVLGLMGSQLASRQPNPAAPAVAAGHEAPTVVAASGPQRPQPAASPR